MAKGRKKKSEIELDERRAKVVSLHVQGLTLPAIGRILGISKQTAYDDLREAQASFRLQMTEDFEGVKNQKLAVLAEVQRKAWKSFNRSLRDKRKETTEVGTSAGKDVDKSRETVEGQSGDSSFLRVICDAVKQECEILGIKAPIQVEVSIPAAMVPVIVTTREEIQTVLKLQEDLTGEHGDANIIDVEPSEGPSEGDLPAGPSDPS